MDGLMATFKAYEYDMASDQWAWREYTRESLIDSVVRMAFDNRYHALGEGGRAGDMRRNGTVVDGYPAYETRLHRRDRRMVIANVLRGVLKDGLTRPEAEAVYNAWAMFWQGRKIEAAV
jgi:hypothetical protein